MGENVITILDGVCSEVQYIGDGGTKEVREKQVGEEVGGVSQQPSTGNREGTPSKNKN